LTEFWDRVRAVPVRFGSDTRPLEHWVTKDRAEATERRSWSSDAILRRFAAALLERNVSGSNYQRRIAEFERSFGDPAALTKPHALDMLKRSGYRYPDTGAEVLCKVRSLLTAPPFEWASYFARAEEKWESGFTDDSLLRITGVGHKTRNFALSEFSEYYCAPDLHVMRIMARSGLVLHGIGDPAFHTGDPLFVCKVINYLARETSFPGQSDALSPAAIDRMFWYYGQDRSKCDVTPGCSECPANDICLTGQNR
jgi:hypothetical protein